jgi:hypothetical protein
MPPDALNISNFAATAGDGQVLLFWNTPSDPAFQKTMIVRKTAAFPVSLTDGTKIYEGTGASYNDTGLINGTTYYYAAFVLTDGGISTMPVAQAQAVPQSGLPAPEPPEGSGTTTPPSVPPSSSGPAVRLVNDNGTFYLIQNNLKRGITNPGILHSYGLSFSDAVPASAGDQSLPASALLPPNNGALVKSAEDPTVYLVSGSRRYGFVSAAVFGELGFNFGNVVIATDPELQSLPLAGNIDDPQSAHLPGVDVDMNGTVYWINSNNAREPYPDLATYNSWHLAGDFRSVVPANGADRALPEGASVVKRTVN